MKCRDLIRKKRAHFSILEGQMYDAIFHDTNSMCFKESYFTNSWYFKFVVELVSTVLNLFKFYFIFTRIEHTNQFIW